MSAFRLRHFSKPAVLRHVQPDALLMLLTRAGGSYVDSRMSRLVVDGHLLVDEVAAMLASPQEGFPAALVDALHQVDEVSHAEGLDAMLTLAEERGVALPDLPADATPADVAVRLWLRDPDCVERVHAEQSIERRRTFESFMGLGRRLSLEVSTPDAATLAALTHDLDTFYERRKRGRHTRIHVFVRPAAIWFLVRHGQPMDRRGVIRGGESTSSLERPERFDVVTYVHARDELRINTGTKGERAAYRELFGLHLFGSRDYFPGTRSFTLAPLLTLGRDALACEDVPGIDWIRLLEVRHTNGMAAREVVTRRAVDGDLFDVFETTGNGLTQTPFQAAFRVKFAAANRPRVVRIKVPNVATWARDTDEDIIVAWLAARGFLLSSDASVQAA